MRKTIVAVFAFVFLCAGVVQAEQYTFTVISGSSFSISGSVSHSVNVVDSYGQSSATPPISKSVSDIYGAASSMATYNDVSAFTSALPPADIAAGGFSIAGAHATAYTVFQPNFSGFNYTFCCLFYLRDPKIVMLFIKYSI